MHKSSAKSGPTISGLMLQAAVYGRVVPVPFGCNKMTYLVIWMANLRKHNSGKKKKQKKGAPPSYAANVDLLLGQNPIAGPLQVWNDKVKLKLDYLVAELTPATTLHTGDADFYAVVAVTATMPISVTYDDYGSEGPVTYTGTTEIPLWNQAYDGPDPVNPHVSRYYPYCYYWKPGSGDTVEVYALGGAGFPNVTKIRIYYAKRASLSYTGQKSIAHDTPIAAVGCGFEQQLGEGSEFADCGLTSQQIIYPHYAGLGSSEFDLGMAQMMPNMRFEVLGAFPMYPNLGGTALGGGDADFADIAECIVRMGQTQAGFSAATSPFSRIHLGLGCSEYPGAVQKKLRAGLEGFQCGPVPYDLPNQAGNILIATASCGAENPVISDTDGNSYTTLFGGSTAVVAYASALGGAARNIVSTGIAGSPSGNDWDIVLYEIGGVDTVLGTAVASGISGFLESRKQHSVSITVASEPGRPVYLFAFARVSPGSGFDPVPFDLWKDLVPVIFNPNTQSLVDADGLDGGSGTAWCLSRYRTVYQPGTYTFTVGLGGFSTPWKLALIAMQGSEPPNYAKPLGEILDRETLNLTRKQCRVFGLRGSMVMDTQRKASDWLGELYEAMNAAPVWAGFKLKSIPRSEVSYPGDVTGDQYTAQGWPTSEPWTSQAGYVSPTSAGPVADLTENDFIAGSGDPLVVVERTAQADRPNILQYEHPARDNDYDKVVTQQPEMGPITLHGPRKAAPKLMPMFAQVVAARAVLGVQARRANYLQNIYKFKLQAKWKLLEPMDLVTLTEPKLGMDKLPVRLTSISESEGYEIECEAEPFVYGLNAPEIGLVADTSAPFRPDYTGIPTPVNPPVIFEPVPTLSGVNNRNDLWMVISDSDPNYGGCAVFVSTDGGASYNPIGLPVNGSGITGYSAADWPAHADPDSADDLPLDLSESLGKLASYSVTEEDSFVFPCYIANRVPTFVQSVQKAQATPLAQAVTGAIAAGDALLVFVHSDKLADDPSGIAVSDSSGNTYVLLQSQPKSGGATTGVAQVWAAYNVAAAGAGANTITVTSANAGLLKAAILEYRNVASASALDQESSASGELNITLGTGNIVTTQQHELLLSYAHASSMTMNGGNPWMQVVTPGASNFFIFDQGRGAPISTYSNSFTFTGFQFEFEVGVLSLKSADPYGIPYELLAYSIAELTSLYHYTLKATGGANKLRRAVFGAPTQGQGIDHPTGARFAFLDPSGAGIFKYTLDPKWIGTTLYFKFPCFNIFGGGVQALSDATAYAYTPTGTVGGVNPIGLPPGVVTVN